MPRRGVEYELDLEHEDWVMLANGLLIGSYIHLHRRRSGERVWNSTDDEVNDRIAANCLYEVLYDREALVDLAIRGSDLRTPTTWQSWLDQVSHSHQRSVHLRLSDIKLSERKFSELLRRVPAKERDLPVAHLPPSEILRHLTAIAYIYILHAMDEIPPLDNWGVTFDAQQAPEFDKNLRENLAPRRGGERPSADRAKRELESLARENRGKRLPRTDVVEVLTAVGFAVSQAGRIWGKADLPAEWRNSGRISDRTRLPKEALLNRLEEAAILSNKKLQG